jgi:hypothetical protein
MCPCCRDGCSVQHISEKKTFPGIGVSLVRSKILQIPDLCVSARRTGDNGCDLYGTDFRSLIWQHCQHKHESDEKPESVLCVANRFLIGARYEVEGVEDMLGLIAAVLIVLWLLGFFAFHVTAGFIHIALIVGLVLLVFHFLRGRSATA